MTVSDPDDSLLLPTTMLAHYQIRTPIGSGAMGTVYEAQDTGLDRIVAVKVLKSEISEDADIVRRFQREARAAARVNHKNLTHIYFVGEADGHHFFAMEHLPGRTLEELVEEDGPMDLPGAIEVLVQAARGLAAAHEADVIHRDVKPSNIMLMQNGEVKVTDFGLAKSLSGEADVTGAGKVMGTPRYMSPEQCRSQKLDARSDLYNLGLLGWYLLTGRHAFDGKTLGVVLDDQMNKPLPPLAEHCPELPSSVHKVLSKFAAKRPEDRPADMNQAIAMLENLRPRVLDLAPLAARGAAFLIDSVLVVVVVVMGIGGAALLIKVKEPGPTLSIAKNLFTFALVVFSQFGMERLVGGSLGKLLFNLRVTGKDGDRPGIRPLIFRFLIRYPATPLILLSSLFSSLAFRLVGISWVLALAAIVAGLVTYVLTRGRTLSDILTGTRVIYRTPRRSQERVTA
jgi:tRNA A-37 threonylcarbamoyl transferase component Bud32/uncharacterized RDD family membrane protein YckC